MPRRARSAGDRDEGNFVSEWFGYRTYPAVAQDRQGTQAQQERRCPLLSEATGEKRTCIKAETSRGICTISSCSNGRRQDWLVCPYRALDSSIFEDVARRLFRPKDSQAVVLIPAPSLAKDRVRQEISQAVSSECLVIAYFQGKLGGEISLSATERSPELF
jgi:Restriction endonuclease NotI